MKRKPHFGGAFLSKFLCAENVLTIRDYPLHYAGDWEANEFSTAIKKKMQIRSIPQPEK